MPEERTERTAYQGLLALMLVAADSESWGFPYWNSLLLDAALQGLAQAPRDGTAHLTAPAAAPTTALVTSGGTLAAGQSLEVVQTFVDDFGRETAASATATQATGDPVTDPTVAATFGSITDSGAGYEGGLFEIWYSWTDGLGGETLPSPVVTTDLPYLAGGLLSEVVVDLPSTPAVAGAAGANIYARHRSGNVVLAYQILVDSVSQATLTGVAADCYRLLPLANSTFSSRAVDITGQAANAGESPALTRFYLRPEGTTWSAGDRRLKLAGVDEWEPATVTYPLRYTGATGELAPGYPPTVSQVKAIRPVDLAQGESTGVLPVAQLPSEATLETELALSTGDGVISGLLVAVQAPEAMAVDYAGGSALLAAFGRAEVVAGARTIPAADASNPRIDIIVLAADGTVQGPSEDAALKGTPAASPAPPATPAGGLLLAEVLVDALAATIVAGKVTDQRYLLPTVRAHVDDADAHFTGTERADRLLSAAEKTGLTGGGATDLHSHGGVGAIFAAGPLALQNAMKLIASDAALQAEMGQHRALVDSFESAFWSADGIVSGLVISTVGSLALPFTAGAALVDGTEYLAIGAGTVTCTNGITNYIYVHTDGAVTAAAAWPGTPHAKIGTAIAAGGVITTVDNTVKVEQSAYDGANDRLTGVTGGWNDLSTGSALDSGASIDVAAIYNPYQNAQSFTATADADLRVSIWTRHLGAGSSTLHARLFPDDGSGTKPNTSGAAIADVTIAGSGAIAWGIQTFPLMTGLSLTPDALYWIVFVDTDTSGAQYWSIGGKTTGFIQKCAQSSNAGSTWSVHASYALSVAMEVLIAAEVVWQSRVVTVAGTLGRLLASWRQAVDDASAWDAAAYAVVLEARVEDGGSWQAFVLDEALTPTGTTLTQLEIRARLRSSDAAHYPIVPCLGVLWELA